MPDVSALSLSGAKVEADAAKTRMAACKMRLFQASFNPTPASVKQNFIDAECDFDGYTEATIAAWHEEVLSGDGYSTYAPTQTFLWTLDSEAVGNAVGGFWLETAGGDLITYTKFDPARPAQGPDQAIIATPVLQYNAG